MLHIKTVARIPNMLICRYAEPRIICFSVGLLALFGVGFAGASFFPLPSFPSQPTIWPYTPLYVYMLHNYEDESIYHLF